MQPNKTFQQRLTLDQVRAISPQHLEHAREAVRIISERRGQEFTVHHAISSFAGKALNFEFVAICHATGETTHIFLPPTGAPIYQKDAAA